jgi:hypothetical protein
MRYVLVAILGLAIGAACAFGVLYFNPFSADAGATPTASDRVFRYSLPDDVLEFSLGEDAHFLGQAASRDGLWEETIDRAAVLGLALADSAGQPVAVASRLMIASTDTDLLLRGVLVADHWLVTVPGEGTLFLRADVNAWPFVRNTLLPAWYLERPWQGPEEYWPTVGPGADGGGTAVGIAGAFAGSEGRVVERYELTSLDKARASVAATGELHLALAGPQVAAQP